MSKIKCNKCGSEIKIKTVFLERAGCENCGNSIDFTSMDQLTGLKQGLMLGAAIVCGVVILIAMLSMGIGISDFAVLFTEMSVGAAGMLLLGACVLVLIVGTLERVIGCSIYEEWRKREEELERIAEKKRREDALQSEFECDNE